MYKRKNIKFFDGGHGDGFSLRNSEGSWGFVEGKRPMAKNFFNHGEVKSLNACVKRRGVTGKNFKIDHASPTWDL